MVSRFYYMTSTVVHDNIIIGVAISRWFDNNYGLSDIPKRLVGTEHAPLKTEPNDHCQSCRRHDCTPGLHRFLFVT